VEVNLRRMNRISQASTHKRYCHSALIFSGSRLLSVGYNKAYCHAEVMAIKRLSRITRAGNRIPKNLHLISYMRKRASGNIGNSCPCENCYREIKKAGIRKVTFFIGDEACQIILAASVEV